jgi:2-polyprenyl-3-methyl-5-hydroxy-6-metoxy-1,4-benzoquinol methylase
VAPSRYPQRVDLGNWNSSHALAVMSVPRGSRVLDLGTADGSVARALKDRGCSVWGIECDARAAADAAQVCDRLIVADLESPQAFDTLDGETFDVVLALDVLEQLRDPARVLRRASAHLRDNGIAIVSIANVTHGALRVSLLQGRFNYTDHGLLDRRHLRLFDRRSAEQLIREAGLTITQNLRVRRELEDTEVAVSGDGLSPELVDSLARDPDSTTYQFVFVAGLEDRLPGSAPDGTLAERLIAENNRLLQKHRKLEIYVKSLENERTTPLDAGDGELRRERDELRQELERRLQEAHALHVDLKQIKAEVVVKDAYISELRQQLDALISQRAELSGKRRQLFRKHEKLSDRYVQLVADRKQLLARQNELERTVRELRAYTNSAGFRIVEGMVRRLKSFPLVFKTVRSMARRIARAGGATVD